jgi:hypothetical protein
MCSAKVVMSGLSQVKMSAFTDNRRSGQLKGETLRMSSKELQRVEIMERLLAKRLSQVEAGQHLGLSTRHVRRLQENYRRDGARGLLSARRGKPSNHRLSQAIEKEALAWIESRYKDFGPTLAHEKLKEVHHLKLSVESVRQLMIREGYWEGKRRRRIVVHQQRSRRSRVGELVQMDGSPHDWFEGRGERCSLLVWVDDATSRLMHLRFEPCETTLGYMRGLKDYVKKHGRPLCLYTDKHGIFRQNQGSDLKELEDPQLVRALKTLGIELICANSPQAKGRVERANGILQDRLIKEMRLRGISDPETANAFLEEFREDYNRRFAVEPRDKEDSHQKGLPSEEELALILSHHEWRQLSKNLELSYHNTLYQVESNHTGYRLQQSRILVSEGLTGEVTLWHQGKSLPYKTLSKQQRRTEILDSKEKEHRVNKVVQARQSKPASTHPWKQLFMLQRPPKATDSPITVRTHA